MIPLIYFLLGVLTLGIAQIMYSYAPHIVARLRQRKTRISHTFYCDELQAQINELKEQIDNVAKNHYNREQNRKSNIRRDIREYLKELQNG